MTVIYPPDGPLFLDNAAWPVANARSYKVPSGVSGRALGGRRDSGTRTHAGIDLSGNYGDTVVAIQDGVIVNFYWFYSNTFALFIQHSGFVINYGEVTNDSLSQYGLYTPKYKPNSYGPTYKIDPKNVLANQFSILRTTGSIVHAGDPIGRIGQSTGKDGRHSSMLHLEMYSSGDSNKRWMGYGTQPPAGLLNPTTSLAVLASRLTGKPVSDILSTTTGTCT